MANIKGEKNNSNETKKENFILYIDSVFFISKK